MTEVALLILSKPSHLVRDLVAALKHLGELPRASILHPTLQHKLLRLAPDDLSAAPIYLSVIAERQLHHQLAGDKEASSVCNQNLPGKHELSPLTTRPHR
eukprot:scaffold145209_cov13-Prasinocladus_malaysianus.AAC.1